jgi:hypothetical protein
MRTPEDNELEKEVGEPREKRTRDVAWLGQDRPEQGEAPEEADPE